VIQQSHTWGYTQRNATQFTPKAPAHPCLLQRYSQYPSYGNSQDTPLLTNALRKWGIYIQWNSTQPWRRMKSYHFEGNGWSWRTSFWARSARLRRPKIVCSPSYVDFRSRANEAMWMDLGHMIRWEHTREIWGLVRNPKSMIVFEVLTAEDLIQKL
jgi:hypothetical protein